jgi:hypothetical protein
MHRRGRPGEVSVNLSPESFAIFEMQALPQVATAFADQPTKPASDHKQVGEVRNLLA